MTHTTLLLLLTFTSFASEAKVDVIYGEDNRKDVYTEKDPTLLTLSKSVAAMIHKKEINGFSFLRNQSYRDIPKKYKICEDERFINQKAIASCSGSLIAADKILTAGHCVSSQKDCDKYRWVFDYKMTDAQTLDVNFKNQQNVYSCKSVVSYSAAEDFDYAIIQLDRPVLNRLPLKISYEKLPVSETTEIAVIGYPSGLPMKIADNGKIKTHSKNGYETNLDTYGGNSGSPVFKKETGEIIGLLLQGQDDFFFDQTNRCFRSNVCDDDGYNCMRYGTSSLEYVGATADMPFANKF